MILIALSKLNKLRVWIIAIGSMNCIILKVVKPFFGIS